VSSFLNFLRASKPLPEELKNAELNGSGQSRIDELRKKYLDAEAARKVLQHPQRARPEEILATQAFLNQEADNLIAAVGTGTLGDKVSQIFEADSEIYLRASRSLDKK
jgi:hypothetical protein